MKNITFLLMMLLSITAFSQVEIVENFDSAPDYGLPTGWTASLNAFSSDSYIVVPYEQCGGTGKSIATAASTDYGETPWEIENILTTPNYPGITNNTDLTVSFSINVFEKTGPWPPISAYAPVSNWGSVTLEYSVDGGATWISAVTVDSSDLTYVDTETCTSIPAVNLGALTAGNDFQARFITNLTNMDPGHFTLNVVLDNVSITQVATTAPNCDATLISPVAGTDTTDLNDTMTWNTATGLPTGYTVSIGTSTGATDVLNAATTTATSYSFAGLGLAYGTEYFVNIVPFNGIGSATGCTEESFTTRMAPIEGATCSNPYVITGLSPSTPYLGLADDTSNYENNINEGPCGGYSGAYLGGYDVFYQITPATDISINIELANIVGNGASIHVTEGCIDTATECTAYVGAYSGTTRNIDDLVLLAGRTYFIVLSSSSSSFSYDLLLITQNTCINPEFTLTPVSECATGEFTVDVDVTYMGDATTLTLTDNFGNTNSNINAAGVTNFGPYASGSTVEFTLTSNNDNACSYTDSTFFYCPPVNDDCTNNIELTVNTDGTNNIFTSVTNAGAAESASNPVNCIYTNTNDIWFSFVATDETIILEYLNITEAIGVGGINQATELLEGSCGAFTSLGCYNNNSAYITFFDLTVNNTYYIRNSSVSSGDYAQNFDISLKSAPAAPANDECSNAIALSASTDNQCNNQITGTTVGATVSADNSCNNEYTTLRDVWYVFTPTNTAYYEFSYEKLDETVTSNYTIYEGTCGALTQLSANCNNYTNQTLHLTSGESYSIMVRSATTAAGTGFNLCVWEVLDAQINSNCSDSITLLESSDSNGDNTIAGNFEGAYYSLEGCSSSSNESLWYNFTPQYTGVYYFDFTRVSGYAYYTVYDTGDCSQIETAGFVSDITSCYNSGATSAELVAGNSYLVFLYASSAAEFEFFAYPDPSLSTESNTFETFKYYPNPVVNTLTVEAKNTISSVSVFNIVGQQVLTASPNSIKSTINMNELKDGVYFVTVTIDGAQKTIKIVKK
ncbi:T9SS type A sorting domain-containing protein [Lacinutrix sp. C3R15]|uniref:T9SS type A sorting domain-containing protein n=1 Tax=Flavobacteriaceae TaxID=49546 RepID=UPI001C099B3E|nr:MULTISPECIES: T9SS type A sorting domain-containing protein [Flavobacteriaceae]MBU2938122.1 T9SS type A sorting domain-containing protein [Lacinutrix sp. C3R15]MDO6621436.1 T9SS type A sorting domain-containing protein [Oceanihabitans sp. 1_MG-2023]